MKPFSYSRCATRIAVRLLIRSLREASCCSVEVVKGADGRRVYGFSATSETVAVTPRIASATATAVASSTWRTLAVTSEPSSAKSRPVATRSPSSAASRALKDSEPRAKSPTMSQYCAALKAIRSRSRSTTMRVTTDCTRPADRPWRTLRHSTGDTS